MKDCNAAESEVTEQRFFTFLQQKSIDSVESLFKSEMEDDRTVSERFRPADHGMRLLTFKLFQHVQGFLGNNTLSVLQNGKLFERSAVEKFCFTVSALLLLFAILGVEAGHPLQIKLQAMSPTELVALDKRANSVRGNASSGDELCFEKNPSLLYGRRSRQL